MSLLITSCSFFGKNNIEQPNYSIIKSNENFEVRKYSSYITANVSVDMDDDYDDAKSRAFKKLASYIFGGNTKNNKISMTAPVVVKAEESESGTKISMTSPVIMKADDKKMTMSFMMPSEYQMNELPTPNDSDITFQTVPERILAVVRYSGISSEKVENKKSKALYEWLEETEYEVKSTPVFAGYNPPWTIPFMRRNEVMVEVSVKK